jgi:sigma-54 dependent transcriptional regulator, acetoin dehydrogenase operon transcriptional activator AcoR
MQGGPIRRAWERFMSEGQAPEDVRDAVRASWQRSRLSGSQAGRSAAPLAQEVELFRRRAENKALLAAARPALERSRAFLADAASMLILADRNGLIFDTEGDPRVIEAGRRTHLERGGRWGEADIGTNAIGTAIATAEPVRIHGAEHFSEHVHVWSCAAAPIRHPLTGDLLGAVDISGPAASFNPQSLALAVAIGQEIEGVLARVARSERDALLRHYLAKRALWLSDGMLVVDRHGLIVHATDTVLHDIARRDPGLVRGNALPAWQDLPAEQWAEQLRTRLPQARVELVPGDEGALGAIVVLRETRRRAAAPGTIALGQAVEDPIDAGQILGESRAMREARDRALRLAGSGVPILIEGETGVGKELFARAIHAAGPSGGGPFVPVNCGGMARDLIASELFGYARGAFTGADQRGRPGKLEAADGGVLCLDEIGEMPLDLQPYLLRVLEDGVVYRLGSHEGRRVALRLVSMTNRSLLEEVKAGRFRSDLYYRIASASLRIPPLRERGEDIVILARHFAMRAARRAGHAEPVLTQGALDRLCRHDWPGNVRELRNVIETAVALAQGEVIDDEDLSLSPVAPVPEAASLQPAPDLAAARGAPAVEPLRVVERERILACVRECHGNLTEAARRLGIARSTLYQRLAGYGVSRPSRC